MFADPQSPQARYSADKSHAKERGIPFRLSFEAWWALWAPHWPSRSSMALVRHDRAGAYEPGNVSVMTLSAAGAKGAQTGSSNPSARLTEADIPRIWDMLRHGVGKRHIGKLFDVTASTIRKIARGETWTHVSGVGAAPSGCELGSGQAIAYSNRGQATPERNRGAAGA